MNKYENGEPLPCIENGEYHSLYDVIRFNQAIISKPGGCTLIDSLASATPVILLEPYGYAEVRNSEIWQRLGYGISYPDWQASGYSMEVLARLQNNLLNRAQRGIDYPTAFANNLHQKAI
jgi:UDP-N-acetylglucosamine:LPS N-acetylglucosamine transferase